jgi:Arc/MetJ family transcription regulator
MNIISLDKDSNMIYHRSMKTTIDIPDKELREAIKHTRARTKRDAVVHAIREFNRRQRLAKLSRILGTFRDFMTREDLKAMREGGHEKR